MATLACPLALPSWHRAGFGRTGSQALGSRLRPSSPTTLDQRRVGPPAVATPLCALLLPAHMVGSAEARAAVPSPQGPGATYPLGASSQLKGLLLTVVFTIFQLLQDLVQHHRPLFLRGLCGSPDGKRGEKNSGEGWRQEERDSRGEGEG